MNELHKYNRSGNGRKHKRSHRSPTCSEYSEPSTTPTKRSRRPGNCPICLGLIDDPTISKDCRHRFCFGCIRQWLSQKSVCPVCKTPIRHVKHNLQLPIAKYDWNATGTTIAARTLIEADDYERLAANKWPYNEHEEYALIDTMITSMRVLLTNAQFHATYGVTQDLTSRLMQLRNTMKRMTRSELFSHSLFRFVIYFMDADRSSLIATNTDVVLDADYVRANRANLRIDWMPFAVREVRAITGRQVVGVDELMTRILDACEQRSKARDALFAYLERLGIEHPRTFYKNMHAFGSANQSLQLYDSNSRYEPHRQLGANFRSEDSDVHVVYTTPLHRDHDVEYVGTTSNGGFPPPPTSSFLRSIPSFTLGGHNLFSARLHHGPPPVETLGDDSGDSDVEVLIQPIQSRSRNNYRTAGYVASSSSSASSDSSLGAVEVTTRIAAALEKRAQHDAHNMHRHKRVSSLADDDSDVMVIP